MQYNLTIIKSSHNFKIIDFSSTARDIIIQFARRLVQKGLVKSAGARGFNFEPIKVYASTTRNRNEFRFHINQFTEFMEFLNQRGIYEAGVKVIEKTIQPAALITAKFKEEWIARDYQEPVLEYMATKDYDISKTSILPIRKFLGLRTGMGKTFCGMKTCSFYKKRTVIIVKPKYIKKWIEDIEKHFHSKVKDIMVVQGSKDLKTLLNLTIENEITAQFIIISVDTMRNYIKDYEAHGTNIKHQGYSVLPEDLFEALGAGIRLIDEVHESFHMYFKIDLYTHVEISISLSATLMNLDAFVEKMYAIAYPYNMRYKDVAVEAHIHTTALMYHFKQPYAIRTMENGSSSYSHIAFENSLLAKKNKIVLEPYLGMVNFICRMSYFKDYQPGDRLAVFASTVDMCTAITNYLKNKYPDKSVKRFCPTAGDPYENLIEPDIRVTTIISGGTAHDIPRLTTVVLTINIQSIQSNIQTMGRLRPIANRKVQFIYCVCQDMQKHMDYHYSKKENLRGRVASHGELLLPFML